MGACRTRRRACGPLLDPAGEPLRPSLPGPLSAFDVANHRPKSIAKPPTQAGQVAQQQRAMIGRTLKRLALDLYSRQIHFVLELTQNADDCT